MNSRETIGWNASLLLVLTAGSVNAGVDCSKEGVAYYFQQGIAADQIAKLCGDAPVKNPPQQIQSGSGSAPAGELQPQQHSDLLYFSSMIVADTVKFDQGRLIYVKKECLEYGVEADEDVADYACGQFYTSIGLAGLEIERAVTGIPFFRDAELVVAGDIKRKVLDYDKLDKHAKKAIKTLFSANPRSVPIPLRKDANPEEIGRRLKILGDELEK